MSWLDLSRVDEPEDIDDPAQPFAELARSMQDVALTNRLFGGTQTILYHTAKLLRDVPAGSRVTILDIATGSADIPQALQAWGQNRGLELSIVGVDNHAGMLQMARETAPAIHLVQADALSLPFPPRSFDLALCALATCRLCGAFKPPWRLCAFTPSPATMPRPVSAAPLHCRNTERWSASPEWRMSMCIPIGTFGRHWCRQN
jgi:hypothetical protein